MLKIEELDCWDLTWFAYDNEGRLAVFFSNGTNAVLTDHILKERNYELAFDYFDNLNANSRTIIDNEGLENIDDFVLYAQKGLLVYDMEDLTQSHYILKVKPVKPLTVNDINKEIYKIIEKYDGVFSSVVKITPSESS